MTITDMIATLQVTLDDLPRIGTQTIEVEISTTDGKTVSDEGKGAKISFTLKAKPNPQ